MKSVSPTTAAHRPSLPPADTNGPPMKNHTNNLYTSHYNTFVIHLRNEKDSKVFKQENLGESGCFPVTCV